MSEPFDLGLARREASDGVLTALALIEAFHKLDDDAGQALLEAMEGENVLAVVTGLAVLGAELLADLEALGVGEWIARRRSHLLDVAAEG